MKHKRGRYKKPHMFCTRVEEDDAMALKTAVRCYNNLTVQDFLAYAIKLFIDGVIVIENNKFTLHNPNESVDDDDGVIGFAED